MLITPHGDRKTVVGSNSNPSVLCLITPHGDRKQMGDRNGSHQHDLITPHGDRKHESPDEWCQDVLTNSLPLMGIVN